MSLSNASHHQYGYFSMDIISILHHYCLGSRSGRGSGRRRRSRRGSGGRRGSGRRKRGSGGRRRRGSGGRRRSRRGSGSGRIRSGDQEKVKVNMNILNPEGVGKNAIRAEDDLENIAVG
uniref:Uncharacterized protein n=1 Tax=Cacopsylla melanoneura TaxID=428564 RepID=A0A8D8RZK9_9HEMI